MYSNYLLCPLQRQAKYSENKLKCTKARNDYLLNLAATNAVVAKYYIHDVSDMIDVSSSFVCFCLCNEMPCWVKLRSSVTLTPSV